MEQEYRAELDKFQILSQQLADAIYMYFSGGYSSTTLHVVHACNNLIRDIYRHYLKKDAIEEINFWSERVANLSDTKLFNFKKIDGEQGLYIHKGNFVKHAQRDTESLILLSDQTAFEYLYACVKDFLLLKEALLKAGVLALSEEHSNTRSRTQRGVLVDKLRRQALYRLGFYYNGKPYGEITQVDYLSTAFLEWQSLIEKFITKRAPRIKQDFHDASDFNVFSNKQRNNLNMDFFFAVSEGIDVLTPLIKMKLGLGSKKDYVRACKASGEFLRETLRRETRSLVLSFIYKYCQRYNFDGAGYYLKVDDRIGAEYKYSRDTGGIDLIR